MTRDSARLGEVLRNLRERKGWTQRELAVAAVTSFTHVSRIESGERSISRDLLARLGEALEAPELLAAAAGRLTQPVEQALAAYPSAFEPEVLERKTLAALRRLEAGAVARPLLENAAAAWGRRIDPQALCRHVKLQPVVTNDELGKPLAFIGGKVVVNGGGPPGDPAAAPRIRFLLAHAAAHVLIDEQMCAFPRMSGEEQYCCDIAAHLLCPSELLRDAFNTALTSSLAGNNALWSFDGGDVIAMVAARLAVPGWVAARRLADEALLDDEALFYSPGGQL